MFNVLYTVVGGYVGRLYDDSVNFIFPETGPIYENGYQIVFKGGLSFKASTAEEAVSENGNIRKKFVVNRVRQILHNKKETWE
jgi:hypothetical protein